ncbi:glycosyl hydrolase family 49-domain-containing protein [Lipomyces starkeyi]
MGVRLDDESGSDVTIRPTTLGFTKQMVNTTTIRIFVPYQAQGYRFSVEFNTQLVTTYNTLSGSGSGQPSTTPGPNGVPIRVEPRNSLLIFAEAISTGTMATDLIPSTGDIYYPTAGSLTGVENINHQIIYFQPGVYYMRSNYAPKLSTTVQWIYLAPGAYVKGSFEYQGGASWLKIAFGVLSGEQSILPNASNNESMVSALHENLRRKYGDAVRFRGLDSYVRCLAHILNLIVQDILHALKSGNAGQASAMCDNLSNREPCSFEDQGVLARLRIVALWIDRSPQRRQKWKEVCKFLDLPDKFIEYDVETRWNSTFRMLSDGLHARTQINKLLQLQSDLPMPCYSDNDWAGLQQIHDILSKFNEFTLFISNKKPQIRLSDPIYYELHELLDDASERSGKFSAIDKDIAAAVKNGLRKYKKYYTFMDAMDTYYTALILDPRVKGDLILQELRDDKDSGRLILQAIRNELHLAYQVTEPAVTELHPPPIYGGHDDLESRMLRRLRPAESPKVSDIDRYFHTVRVVVSDTKQPNWLCDWWRRNKDEHPQMALAAIFQHLKYR